jgi:hypothetical protein
MNKLSREAKELYTECYKAIELGRKKEKLEGDLPIDPTRIAIVVLRNLKTVSKRKFNDTLAQYYYLGLANKYLEDKEEMTPKEVRELSNQTRTEYAIGRFMVETFEEAGYIAYLENISPDRIGSLMVQEARTITYQLTKAFPWRPKNNEQKRKSSPNTEDIPRKRLETKLLEAAPDVTEAPESTSLSEPQYLDLDFIEELMGKDF